MKTLKETFLGYVRTMNKLKRYIRKASFRLLRNTAFIPALQNLTPNARFKVFCVINIQIFLNLLDLLGILIIGILSSVTISGISNNNLGERTKLALNMLRITDEQFQTQVMFLAAASGILLILKTFISMFLTKKTIYFLSKRAAELSSQLTSKLLVQGIEVINQKSVQSTIYALTEGTNRIMVGILSNSVSLAADVSLVLLMFSTLFFIDTWIGFLSTTIFGVIGVLLYILFQGKVKDIGISESRFGIATSEAISEVIVNYRELFVKNRRSMYSEKISTLRFNSAKLIADGTFFQGISKYVMELTVVIGGFIICLSQFYLHTAQHAIAVLTIFIAASSRIAPAVLRIQQASLSLKQNMGAALPTLELIDNLNSTKSIQQQNVIAPSTFPYNSFLPSVSLTKVSFTYEAKSEPAIDNLSLNIEAGSTASIVGRSGAGKTTLVDLILGIQKPQFGEIKVSGKEPEDAIQLWPGAIAYVPQDVAIVNGTILENITLGYPELKSSVDDIQRAITVSNLSNFIDSLPEGVNTYVGERGTRLSGGQRQRIGIARALITRPKLIILDEATSSLDGLTEADISEAINNLKGDLTIIIIAHRLSTVINSNAIFYLDAGSLVATGTFEEVRRKVPDFDLQAKLSGL